MRLFPGRLFPGRLFPGYLFPGRLFPELVLYSVGTRPAARKEELILN